LQNLEPPAEHFNLPLPLCASGRLDKTLHIPPAGNLSLSFLRQLVSPS